MGPNRIWCLEMCHIARNRESGNIFVSEYGHVGTLKRGLEKPQMMKKELTHSNHFRLRKRPKCDLGSV